MCCFSLVILLCRLVWSLFVVFTFFHLYANYKAVSAVKMETLNQQRLHIVLTDYLSTGAVPSPASVNAREPILGGIRMCHHWHSLNYMLHAVYMCQHGRLLCSCRLCGHVCVAQFLGIDWVTKVWE